MHIAQLIGDTPPQDGNDYDPFDKEKAMMHINQPTSDLHNLNNTVDRPFNTLSEQELCPGNSTIMEINEAFR